MGTLSRKEILEKLDEGEQKDRIVITPIFDREKQINQIGIDCRLSNQFIIFKTQSIESFDIGKFSSDPIALKYLFKEVVVPFGKNFILHPQTMVLGSTFEFLSLPENIAASIEGRSSWARTGLMVATASYVEPGFKGCITLELSNVSNIPIKLIPGLRIGQIIFYTIESKTRYENKKYLYPIGPEITKIHEDSDIHFIHGLKEKTP